ncbi:MAG: hypothetical protein WC867_03650 [Candidatus Pacearchaeota archaeon]|jgi:hypothetical protein
MQHQKENYTEFIEFPLVIGEPETKTLVKYLGINLEWNCFITFEQNKRYVIGDPDSRPVIPGSRTIQEKIEALKEIYMFTADQVIKGRITRPGGSDLIYSFNSSNDSLYRDRFNGLLLGNFTNSCEGLSYGEEKLVMEVKDVVRQYFLDRDKLGVKE